MAISRSHVDDAYQAWKQADARAREYEAKLAHAWSQFDQKHGPAPSERLFAEVALHRTVAHEKLTHVLKAMKAQMEPGDRSTGDSQEHAS